MPLSIPNEILTELENAKKSNALLPESLENARLFFATSSNPLYLESITELVQNGNWQEINDRFFKQISFGTGGLRSRTIGNFVTKTEIGSQNKNTPEIPCIGTNAMNFYNISRAVQGWVKFLTKAKETNTAEETANSNKKVSVAIAHDTRLFSRIFTQFSAKVLAELGVHVFIFASARSTPQLSFTVRELNADGGAVFTASHNPPHDNGFKVYNKFGGQIINPAATELIQEVNAVESENYKPLPAEQQGKVIILDEDYDKKYLESLDEIFLRKNLKQRNNSDIKIVYTNLHGTGGKVIPDLLRNYGVNLQTVPSQDIEDGLFPTVKSPNPENPPALKLATEQAQKNTADFIIGTDPDCDRLAIAIKNNNPDKDSENFVFLTGNQIGSLLAHYRINALFDTGLLNKNNASSATIIKTYVTTELQRAIASHYGIKCVDTLTGFKYIAAKLQKYFEKLNQKTKNNFSKMNYAERAKEFLEQSTFYIFGGEESFGYLGSESVRDKDGNAAALMLTEMLIYLQSSGKNVLDYLDDIYCKFGYYKEVLHALQRPGAKGSAEISKLSQSYLQTPPKSVDGSEVERVVDFSKGEITDNEGDKIPAENMLFVHLKDGRSFAVRPSGTEPKIKFYLMAKKSAKKFAKQELPEVKEKVSQSLNSLWTWLEKDASERISA